MITTKSNLSLFICWPEADKTVRCSTQLSHSAACRAAAAPWRSARDESWTNIVGTACLGGQSCKACFVSGFRPLSLLAAHAVTAACWLHASTTHTRHTNRSHKTDTGHARQKTNKKAATQGKGNDCAQWKKKPINKPKARKKAPKNKNKLLQKAKRYITSRQTNNRILQSKETNRSWPRSNQGMLENWHTADLSFSFFWSYQHITSNYACICSVCVCVCVWERERERQADRQTDSQRQRLWQRDRETNVRFVVVSNYRHYVLWDSRKPTALQCGVVTV